MKKRFFLYVEDLEIIKDLSREQNGKLFEAIFDYQTDNVKELDPITEAYFSQFRKQFIRDEIAYNKKCDTNSNNVSGRWKKDKDDTNEYERIPSNTNDTNGYESIPNIPPDTDKISIDEISIDKTILDYKDYNRLNLDKTKEEEKNALSGIDEYELK